MGMGFEGGDRRGRRDGAGRRRRLPQLRRVLVTGLVGGVSASAAGLGAATEMTWIGYTVTGEMWAAVPEACLMLAANVLLLAALVRAGVDHPPRRVTGLLWLSILVATAAAGGPPAIAAVLAVAYAVQVAPAVWPAYRSTAPTGVSPATWALVGIEALLWGVYGVGHGDPANISFGVIGTFAAVAILIRTVPSRAAKMARMPDLTQCTATELLDLYADGSASPVEATRAVLDRIEAVEPDAQRLLPRRRRRGAGGGRGERGPLAARASRSDRSTACRRRSRTSCSPRAGRRGGAAAPSTRTSRGTSTRRRRPACARPAPCCSARRRRPSSAARARRTPTLTGITRNPWDPTKTPGGSSGGTAAAVAAGLGPLGVGTDGAGSVRIPAAFCGNVGLKPSFGRVPAYPLSPFGTVSHLGPHTMSVRRRGADDERAQAARRPRLDVAAARPTSTTSPGSTTASPGCASPTRRRSATPTSHPEVAAAVAAAVEDARRARARIVEAVDPGFDDPLEITTGLWFTGAWTLWNTLTPEQQAVTDPDFAAEAELGSQPQQPRRPAAASCAAAISARTCASSWSAST